MNHRPGALNRVGLALTAVLLLLVGIAGLLLASGRADQAAGGVPQAQDRVADLAAGWSPALVTAIAGVVGLLLVVLAVGWLQAQLPRARRAAPFRLSDDPEAGLTSVSARMLADAVAADVTSLPGAIGADVVVRGAADRPELVIAVTARTDADLAGLLAEVRHGVVSRFETAVGTPVRHTGIRLDLVRRRADADQLTVA